MTAAALSVRLAARAEAVDAGGDGGLQCCRHTDFGDITVEQVRARVPRIAPRSARSRTISSAKNGLPAVRSAIRSARRCTEEWVPRSSPISVAVCDGAEGPQRDRLRSRTSSPARPGIQGDR